MATAARNLSDDIDGLLERYLSLLDQYTTLRSSLSTTQSSVQQFLARANFDAPRGVRYGRDFYDTRMQASRLGRVTGDPELGTAGFTISTVSSHEAAEDNATEAGLKEGQDAEGSLPRDRSSLKEDDDTKTPAASQRGKDPIRMFGILTPQSLRMAQSEAIKLVQELIPQLATTDTEMKELEIQIRRARKQRSKAEALEKRRAGDSSDTPNLDKTDPAVPLDNLVRQVENIQV